MKNPRTYIKRAMRAPLARQAGVSAVQVVIALAVGALMLAGGAESFKYIEHQKVNNDMQDLTDIRAGLVDFASKHNSKFTSFTLDIGCRQQIFPASSCSGTGAGATVGNLWGGTYTFQAVDLNGGDDNGGRLSSSQLSDIACIKEVTAQWGQWARIEVGATPVKTSAAQAIDDVAINSACSSGSNTVHWTVRS